MTLLSFCPILPHNLAIDDCIVVTNRLLLITSRRWQRERKIPVGRIVLDIDGVVNAPFVRAVEPRPVALIATQRVAVVVREAFSGDDVVVVEG
jgi:hypothetical protein